MIVDMERNDLSRICKTGSVKIDKLKQVEEYRDLFHYVTTIKGYVKNKVSNLLKSFGNRAEDVNETINYVLFRSK